MAFRWKRWVFRLFNQKSRCVQAVSCRSGRTLGCDRRVRNPSYPTPLSYRPALIDCRTYRSPVAQWSELQTAASVLFPAQLHTETSEWFSENQRKACESPEIGLISVLILWKVTFPVLLSIEKCFAHLLWNWIATDNVESSQPSPRPQFEDLRTGLFVRT